jgi:aubergine-like protein
MGQKLIVGNMLMAQLKGGNQRNSFSIEDNRDLDRKVQAEMYSQPQIKSMAIIHSSRDEAAAKSFIENLVLARGSFNYPMDKPRIIRVEGNQFRDWEKVLQTSELQKDDAVILIIPGNRGKGPLYSQLKKLLITNLPIPSQIILSGTITKGKNLRSIVNKILIQICAKIGGEPWAIDNMPCTNQPTMVCGIDTFSKKGKDAKTILGLTASFNRTFTKYFSTSKQSNSPTEKVILGCMDEALKNFGKCNNAFPKHIIVIRDGVTPTQFGAVARDEVEQIKQVLVDMKLSETKLTYVMLNKKTNVKIFQNTKNYQVPLPGTVVDGDLGGMDKNDFYLIPQKTNQGLATPIYYSIAYDDKGIADEEIQNLVYKLCYLYYNFTGGIKVPSPCQYAKKLAYLLGDKLSTGNDTPIPNKLFKDRIRSLYYL